MEHHHHLPHEDDDDALLAAQFRLSVDSDSERDDVMTDPTHATPHRSVPLALPLPMVDTADAALWNLISPCSDVDEHDTTRAFEEIPINEEHVQDRPEPEAESPRRVVTTVMKAMTEQEEVRYAASSDDEDEEVEVYNADAAFPATTSSPHRRRRSRSLDSDSDHKPKDEKGDSVTEADELDELDALSSSASSSQLFMDETASEDGSTSTTSSTAASFSGRWVGRVKARTYSGPASTKMHAAYDMLRARTRSATATLRHVTTPRGKNADDNEDDGGFSSDDEDYDPTRPSRVSTPSRATSLSFPTRLSAVKTSAVQLPTKMSSMLRFRTSSSATTSSEESFIGSYGSSLDSTLGPVPGKPDAQPTSISSSSGGAGYSRQELKHKATACATRAAGLLGAASAEAARKLRTSRAFRTASQPAMGTTDSPVVENDDGLPPLPGKHTPLPAYRSTSS